MAFTPDTLSAVVQSIGGAGIRMFTYVTDDAFATVTGTDYFLRGKGHGLRVSDLIFVSPVTVDTEPYTLVIETIDADGNGTAVIGTLDFENVFTASRVADIKVPSSVDAILLAGDENPGDDNDGQPVLLVRDPDATVGYIQDAAATKFAYLSRTVTLSKALWGFDPSDLTGVANRNAFMDALTYLKGKRGGEIVIPGEAFIIDSAIFDIGLTGDLTITGKPGNLIKSVAGFQGQMLHFAPRRIYYQTETPTGYSLEDLWFDQPVTSATLGTCRKWNGSSWDVYVVGDRDGIYLGRLDINGLFIDNSQGSSGGLQISGIVADYYKQFNVNNCEIYGGSTWDNTSSDSGISPICCRVTHIRDTVIRGQNDQAIYFGGDNKFGAASGDAEAAYVSGGFYENNASVFTSKRELKYLSVEDVRMSRNRVGISTLPVSAGFALVGREVHVRNCLIEKTESRAIEFQDHTKGTVMGTTFRDAGYDLTADDGSVVASTSAHVIINGASGIEFKSNTFEAVDTAPDPTAAANRIVAYNIVNHTDLNGTLYTAGKLIAQGNTYRGINRVTLETADIDPCHYQDEILDGMLTDVPSTLFSSLVAGSQASWRKKGELVTRYYSTLYTAYSAPRRVRIVTSNITLTAEDVNTDFINTGATAQVEITLPAAVAGMGPFIFTVTDTDGIRVRAGAGDFIRTASGQSTAAGYTENATAGSRLILYAPDSAQYLTDSQAGTWTVA